MTQGDTLFRWALNQLHTAIPPQGEILYAQLASYSSDPRISDRMLRVAAACAALAKEIESAKAAIDTAATEIVTQCCQCRDYRMPDGTWGPIEGTPNPKRVSHGLCPPCKLAFMETNNLPTHSPKATPHT